jgi:hypothetical protein
MARITTRSADMNVYTVLLIVAALTMLAGLAIVAMANGSQASAVGKSGFMTKI